MEGLLASRHGLGAAPNVLPPVVIVVRAPLDRSCGSAPAGASPGPGSAERPEEVTHVADEKVGFSHGREVTAAIELGPVHDLVGNLAEPPHRSCDLPRHTRHPPPPRPAHPVTP